MQIYLLEKSHDFFSNVVNSCHWEISLQKFWEIKSESILVKHSHVAYKKAPTITDDVAKIPFCKILKNVQFKDKKKIKSFKMVAKCILKDFFANTVTFFNLLKNSFFLDRQ